MSATLLFEFSLDGLAYSCTAGYSVIYLLPQLNIFPFFKTGNILSPIYILLIFNYVYCNVLKNHNFYFRITYMQSQSLINGVLEIDLST